MARKRRNGNEDKKIIYSGIDCFGNLIHSGLRDGRGFCGRIETGNGSGDRP